MPKHDFFSPKAVANRIKAKGLQRLRWYCQMCEKQCRDENGFKCHCASESHQRQMAIFAENPGRYLSQFSQEFEQAFLSVLSRRYGTKKVPANQVYQEIVADRQHLHMNATRWDTLSDFVKYLGREGKCKVEDSERGWMIEWIDTSPEALARKAAIMKKERQEMDDEQREQQLLREQIERAKGAQLQAGTEATGLVRKDADKPIKLSLKPSSLPASGTTSLLKPNKLVTKAKPIVKSNPFRKAASSLSSMQTTNNKADATASSQHKQTAVEEIMQQDLRRKEMRRNRSRSPQASHYKRQRSRSPYRN
ncbi:hypothetical protein IWW36_000367 [Coemansia brasiliensis]|uniref:DNA/RNA-binding protein Kin17 WH-like domain-containing protein n=1 Tax=Coemansia brasiliensis TaxID=2650707 RepID=A0A9W8IB62_9FUNG|nr:hypothetical protein IWW36_000367 [Coemansia brasiliensis]